MAEKKDEKKETDELEQLQKTLQSERDSFAQERTQYQQRITDLQIKLGERVDNSNEQKRLARERVEVLRKELAKPHSAAERNALAVELAGLEPLI